MSVTSGDYNNYSAGGSTCQYNRLGSYTSGYSMSVPAQGKVTSGAYIVPQWSPISYESLTAKVPTCSGYSSIQVAYGAGAGSCQTTYATALCGQGR